MKKNFILLFAMACIAGKSFGQQIIPCGTEEMSRKYKKLNPQVAIDEQKLEENIAKYLESHKGGNNSNSRTTSGGFYDIPVVVHVMHDYGAELLADDKIYQLIAEMNKFYSLSYDTSAVIKPFKQYVGNAKMRFHLATKDPNGNPTKGITHRQTYLCKGGDDQSKMDQWSPSNYLNIWFESVIGAQVTAGIIVAYATQPPSAASFPFYDGVICNYQFINDAGTSNTGGGSIDHEVGHIFNLNHTFGHTNNPGTNHSGSCGDDDGVDDTPPTQGHLGGCSLYDTVCAKNYYKLYTNAAGLDSLVNYPDTADEQNIMNYADCKNHFTKGQVARMYAALNDNVGFRDSLWSDFNLATTGALSPLPDLPPVTDYSVKVGGIMSFFAFPGTPVAFTNRSWGDTIASGTGVNWTFSNGAAIGTTASTGSVTNTFTDPGWVTMTMAATGNNSGTTTTTYDHSVFIADAAGTPAGGYYQEFDPSGDWAKWPMFNYYHNEFKWQIANVGFDDGYSAEYVGYDSRYNPLLNIYPATGTPKGDYDDMFSIPVDLSGFTDTDPYLNFYYSGASRSSNSLEINDTLFIDYSKDKNTVWTNLVKLTKGTLENVGASAFPHTPTSYTDWAPQAIPLAAAVRSSYTTFRFRYKPGVGQDGVYSTGNNFYMDRINFSKIPASVGNMNMGKVDVAVVPNPTSGDAYVVVKDADNTTAQIIVSDITGKVVYTTSQPIRSNEAQIQIPHAAIAVQGVYLVQTITGNQTHTLKLVVY